jgi:hypothetical protein
MHHFGVVAAPLARKKNFTLLTLPPLRVIAAPLPPLLPLAPLPLPLVKAALAMAASVGLIVLPRLECATSLFLLLLWRPLLV